MKRSGNEGCVKLNTHFLETHKKVASSGILSVVLPPPTLLHMIKYIKKNTHFRIPALSASP